MDDDPGREIERLEETVKRQRKELRSLYTQLSNARRKNADLEALRDGLLRERDRREGMVGDLYERLLRLRRFIVWLRTGCGFDKEQAEQLARDVEEGCYVTD